MPITFYRHVQLAHIVAGPELTNSCHRVLGHEVTANGHLYVGLERAQTASANGEAVGNGLVLALEMRGVADAGR